MSNEEVRVLLSTLKPMQEHPQGHIFPCPRCGYDRMHQKAVRNALSRHADVYICSECGMDEALRDMAGMPLPLKEWSMAISFEGNRE